jgi:hypothetical protein
MSRGLNTHVRGIQRKGEISGGGSLNIIAKSLSFKDTRTILDSATHVCSKVNLLSTYKYHSKANIETQKLLFVHRCFGMPLPRHFQKDFDSLVIVLALLRDDGTFRRFLESPSSSDGTKLGLERSTSKMTSGSIATRAST